MANKLELAYDIKEFFKAYSDDIELSNEYILYLYRNKRSKHLRRLLNDYTRKFDKIILQNLCISIEETTSAVCGVSTCGTIMRTKVKLPTLIDLRSRSSLVSVGPSLIASENFKLISEEQAPYILDKPFSTGIYAFISSDGYLYFLSNSEAIKLIDCVYVTAVFDNPEDLENFADCCSEDCTDTANKCFTDETEYPLQGFLIDEISNEIKKELSIRYKIEEDVDNNATEG